MHKIALFRNTTFFLQIEVFFFSAKTDITKLKFKKSQEIQTILSLNLKQSKHELPRIKKLTKKLRLFK